MIHSSQNEQAPAAFSPPPGFPDFITLARWLCAAAPVGDFSRPPADREIDWDLVFTNASWHGLTPLLYRLGEAADFEAMPPAASRNLRAAFTAVSLNNARLLRETIRLTSLAAQAGVPLITLKGVALAILVYADAGMRTFEDIDVLTDESEYRAISALLTKIGYGGVHHAAMPSRFRDNSEEFIAPGGLMIDLHWNLVQSGFGFSPPVTLLRERMTTIETDAGTIRSLSVEDSFLLLAVHAAKHGWINLGAAFDAAALIARHPALDWSEVGHRADAYGSRRRVMLALEIARRVARVEIPRALGAADGTVNRLAHGILTRAMCRVGGKPEPFRHWIVPTLSLEGAGRKAFYLLDRAISPRPEDWEMLRTRHTPYALYAIVRPLRLLARKTRRIVYGPGR